MNADTIKAALYRRYSGDATAIAFEVAAGTGRHAHRHVDAVVMELWPSRGLTLHAMEIKTSTSDLKRELKDPQKAEEIAQYCDFFSLVTPLDLIKRVADVVPPAWGLTEIDGNGVFKTAKEPRKTKARRLDREFMAALFRAVSKPMRVENSRDFEQYKKVVYENFEKEVNARVESRRGRDSKDASLWQELERQLKANGVPYVWNEAVLKALVFVMKSGTLDAYNGVRQIQKSMLEAADKIRKAADEAGLPQLEAKK